MIENDVYVSQSATVPPYGNTGVLDTNVLELIACLDWFSATFLAAKNVQEIAEILGLNYADFCKLEFGNRTYRKCMMLGHIKIYYEGITEQNGIFVELSGQACREFESVSSKDWKQLLLDCMQFGSLNDGVNFPRIDVAIDQICRDEVDPYFTVPQLVKKAKKAEFVSRTKQARRMEQIDLTKGESKGNTLYVGSPKSNAQIRFYEKHHERKNNKVELHPDVTYWLRTEIQMRNEYAKSAVFAILNGDGLEEICLGILNNNLSIRVKDGDDSNRSRWPVWRPWERFLNNAKKIPLSMQPAEPTIYQKKYYMEKQFSRTMAILFLAFGNDFDQFVRMIDQGMEKLKDVDLHNIKRFIEAEHLPMTPKSMEEFTQKIETNAQVRRLFDTNPNNIIEQLKLF